MKGRSAPFFFWLGFKLRHRRSNVKDRRIAIILPHDDEKECARIVILTTLHVLVDGKSGVAYLYLARGEASKVKPPIEWMDNV